MAKLSDKEFWSLLRECGGLYARTARMAKKEYNVDISRTAVKLRAERKPDLLEDIREQNIDIAEEGLHSLMRSKNEKTKLKACEIYLKTIGKGRGYSEKLDVNYSGTLDVSQTTKFTLKRRKK